MLTEATNMSYLSRRFLCCDSNIIRGAIASLRLWRARTDRKQRRP